MLNMIGTVRNTVKLAEADMKWQQKKSSGKLKKNQEMTPEMRMLEKYKEQAAEMREQRQMAGIEAKIKSGEALTPEEIEYLKKKKPEAYRDYEEIQREKQAYEKELKSCKTKDDVEKLKLEKMGSFMAQAKSVSNNPNIPKGKKLALMEKILAKANGIQKVYLAFTKTAQYQQMPTEEELAEEEKEQNERQHPLEGAEEGSLPEIGEAEENALPELGEAEEGSLPELGETVEESSLPGLREAEGTVLPGLGGGEKSPAVSSYEEVRQEVTSFITQNRPIGYGMEYLPDTMKKEKHE